MIHSERSVISLLVHCDLYCETSGDPKNRKKTMDNLHNRQTFDLYCRQDERNILLQLERESKD